MNVVAQRFQSYSVMKATTGSVSRVFRSAAQRQVTPSLSFRFVPCLCLEKLARIPSSCVEQN